MRKKSNAQENSSFGVKAVAPWRVLVVSPLPNYQLEVKFVDGVHGLVDMAHLIMSEKAGIFAALKDKSLFEQAYVDYGAVTWPGEIDLAPDAMHNEIKKQGRWVL